MEKEKFIEFYYRRFLASIDVKAMTTAEVGAYILLLLNSIDQNERGHLPLDEEKLRKLTGMGPKTWEKSKDKVLIKFKKNSKGYYNETMLKVIKEEVNSASLAPENNNELHPLQKYVASFPRISKLYPYQLTFKQCEMLLAQFSKSYIEEKIGKMENNRNVWPSVFQTIQIWCKKDLKK